MQDTATLNMKKSSEVAQIKRPGKWKKYFRDTWQIYVLFLPAFIWLLLFVFLPFGINLIMSFENYQGSKGIFGSKFVGFQNYITFFTADNFVELLLNTLLLNVLVLVIGFPCSIILAIMIYESKRRGETVKSTVDRVKKGKRKGPAVASSVGPKRQG